VLSSLSAVSESGSHVTADVSGLVYSATVAVSGAIPGTASAGSIQ
nr:hypothetical protein [Tanacetum cinerariifolium]